MTRSLDVEAWAFDVLARSISEQGSSLQLIRRPDLEERALRAVDLDGEGEGRLLAIEVTRLAPSMGLVGPAGTFVRDVRFAVQRRLGTDPVGHLVLDMPAINAPGRRDWPKFVGSVAEAVVAALPGLSSADVVPVALQEVASDARLIRLRAGAARFDVIWGTCGVSTLLTGRAEHWLSDLVRRKRTQTEACSKAWIVIVDIELLLGEEDLNQAIVTLGDQLPPSWERIFFIPAHDRSRAIELALTAA